MKVRYKESMLTKNAKNFLLYGLMDSKSQGSSDPVPLSSFSLINVGGTEITALANNNVVKGFVNALNNTATAENSPATTYIKCGTGATAATESDYGLEIEVTDLSCDSVATAVGSNDTKTYTATFSNATDTDITVTEIGFFVYSYYGSTSNSDNFLLDHIILDTPITIPAGESKPITYEIGF